MAFTHRSSQMNEPKALKCVTLKCRFQGTLDRLRDEMGAEMTASEVAHCGTVPETVAKS